MSVFLLSKNNLGDVEDIEKARQNLGINSLDALDIDTSDIDITGGRICVEHFCLKPPNADIRDGYILLTDENGCARWSGFTQDHFNSNIMISSFINDLPYASEEWTSNFYLNKNNNLSDLTDIDAAFSNLGLDTLFGSVHDVDGQLFQHMQNIVVDDMRVEKSLNVQGDIVYPLLFNASNNMLYLDPVTTKIRSIELGNDMDDLFNNIVDEPKKRPPSMYLLNEVYQTLNSQFTLLNNTLDDLVIDNYYYKINCNLDEITDPTRARSNIGLGDITFKGDSVELGSITINNKITITPYDLYTHSTGLILTCDEYGTASWCNIPEATLDTLGTVRIAKDYGINPNNDDLLVPNLMGIKAHINQLALSINDTISAVSDACLKTDNFFGEYQELDQEQRDGMLDNLRVKTTNIRDFPHHLSAFDDDVGYFRTSNFLSEITNHVDGLELTRRNLHLLPIAWTASYKDLKDAPFIGDFEAQFLHTVSNLEDVPNATAARANLGLTEMSTMDKYNVEFLGGTISDLTSITTDELYFRDLNNENMPNYDSLKDTLFLKAGNPNGMATWQTLPEANYETPTKKGIVCMVNNPEDASLHSVFTSKYVEDKINTLITNDIAENTQAITELKDSVYNETDGLVTRVNENELSITDIISTAESFKTDTFEPFKDEVTGTAATSIESMLTKVIADHTTLDGEFSTFKTDTFVPFQNQVTGPGDDSMHTKLTKVIADHTTLDGHHNTLRGEFNTFKDVTYDTFKDEVTGPGDDSMHTKLTKVIADHTTLDGHHNTLRGEFDTFTTNTYITFKDQVTGPGDDSINSKLNKVITDTGTGENSYHSRLLSLESKNFEQFEDVYETVYNGRPGISESHISIISRLDTDLTLLRGNHDALQDMVNGAGNINSHNSKLTDHAQKIATLEGNVNVSEVAYDKLNIAGVLSAGDNVLSVENCVIKTLTTTGNATFKQTLSVNTAVCYALSVASSAVCNELSVSQGIMNTLSVSQGIMNTLSVSQDIVCNTLSTSGNATCGSELSANSMVCDNVLTVGEGAPINPTQDTLIVQGNVSVSGSVTANSYIQINTVALLEATVVDTHDLNVRKEITYTGIMDENDVPMDEVTITNNSVMITNTYGGLRFTNALQIMSDTTTSGIVLKNTHNEQPNMQIYTQEGRLMIAKQDDIDSSVYQVKHIFR
jgi:hypothetical protein